MLSLKKDSFRILARAYYGGSIRFTTELPTDNASFLVQSGVVETLAVCSDSTCEYNDKAAGNICKYTDKFYSDHDCCEGKYYVEMPDKVGELIRITDKGRDFFEKMARSERIHLLLGMKAWAWALYEVNKLTIEELPAFLSHKRSDIRKGAWERLNTLDILGRL